jgi:hypothetical protein
MRKTNLTTKITLRRRSGQAPDMKGSENYNSELRGPFGFAQGMLRVLRGENPSFIHFTKSRATSTIRLAIGVT